MAKRRLRRAKKKATVKKVQKQEQVQPEERKGGFSEFYERHYYKILVVPFIILLLALAQIAVQAATTGEFITRGVSLKGGTTATIPTDMDIDASSFAEALEQELGQDINVRVLRTAGAQTAIVVESDATEKADTDRLLDELEGRTGIGSEQYSVDVIGSSLGESFFRQILIALAIAFVFMGIVVYLYFRTLVPSAAVILAAFSDMAITVAVLNMIGLKISSAGIAAFLMLIGYSIDTNILLSTNVVKRKEGTVLERIWRSMKTGLTMSFTTLAAILTVLILSNSEILTQIMTILLIGLLVDLLMTWVQNAGILRWYVAKNE